MDKVIFVKELRTGITKKQEPYPIVVDQDNNQWHVFQSDIKIDHNRVYLFTYHKNREGFNDIDGIKPLENIFKARALKELANTNDVIKNYSICLSYATNLAMSGRIELDDIFAWAGKYYKAIMDKADSMIPKEPEIQTKTKSTKGDE